MGLSVFNQCDKKQYFSISTIETKRMKENGLNMTKKELQERAKQSVPYAEILTGQSKLIGQRRKTKIYRYVDFKEE